MDYSHKPGVVHTELLLPERAPPEFSFRAALWNSVEKAEKQWNSQLARRIIMALPRELSQEDNIRLVRQYCQEQFVDKGMCCDFAIHDDGDGNPHAHILLTMRGLDEHGKWLPKARKVYDLDENGERIRLPSGNWKSHKENTVDWNDQSKADVWRHQWEVLQNQYLEAAGRPERVSLQTLDNQGIQQIPTVHLGPAVANLERKGVPTDIGSLQREVLNINRILEAIRKVISDALNRIQELQQSKADYLLNLAYPNDSPTVSSFLWQHFQQREMERQEWNSSKARLEASAKDYNWVAETADRLQKAGILTIEDLNSYVCQIKERHNGLSNNLRIRSKRARVLEQAILHHESLSQYRRYYDEYSGIFFKGRKEKYYSAHRHEIDACRSALRFFENHEAEKHSTIPQLSAEQYSITEKNKLTAQRMEHCKSEADYLGKICYWVQQALQDSERPAQSEESKKPSIRNRLRQSRADQEGRVQEAPVRDTRKRNHDHER